MKTAKVKVRVKKTKQIPGNTYPFYCVEWEYERGWGSKVFHVHGCLTKEEAERLKKECNDKNTAPTAPDWYVMAELSTDNYYAKYIGK